MKHRYGRHGDKAWLKWRKKHFRRASLTPVPQVVVLHVPLEFLSRIRKVTILMDDGTEEIMNITAGLVYSQSVDPDTDKYRAIDVYSRENVLTSFFEDARRIAREEAEKVFKREVDPYTKQPNEEEARAVARVDYYNPNNKHLKLEWSKSGDAFNRFLSEFNGEYKDCLYQLSFDCGASTKPIQDLLVAARTDKVEDYKASPTYSHDERIFVRAHICFLSGTTPCQKDVDADMFGRLHEIMSLYQKFYAEFDPPKEED